MQRPENSTLFCCFLAWRLAGYISRRPANYICRRSYKEPLQNNLVFYTYFITVSYAVPADHWNIS